MVSKYTYGDIGRTRKLTGSFVHGPVVRHAGIKLRRQAIERTQREILEPLQTWGISGTWLTREARLSAGGIRAHATKRLELLRTLAT